MREHHPLPSLPFFSSAFMGVETKSGMGWGRALFSRSPTLAALAACPSRKGPRDSRKFGPRPRDLPARPDRRSFTNCKFSATLWALLARPPCPPHPQPITPPATPAGASVPATRAVEPGRGGGCRIGRRWGSSSNTTGTRRRSCCGAPARRPVLTRMLDRELEVETPTIDDYSDAELAHPVRLARPPRTALTVFNGETGAEPRQRRSGPSAHRTYGV